MGQPRRRGYPHGRHHRCPRGIALPAAGAGLLFLSVSLLSVSLLSAPPLADPRPGLGTSSSSSRRFLRRHPIVDAVVAARILNATLVVPKLDQTSFWKDSSNFSEIFDMDWFISFLAKDVRIIKEPPEKGGKAMKPYKMRVPRKCTPRCYLNRVLPALLKKHIRDPEKGRRQGRCPLTPEEVGLMLRALGYRSDVHIYVASGEIYGGEDTLASLKALFPNFHTKETLSSQEELAPFLKFSSRMAAIDFIVCEESDAFVANNIGNMAKILAGQRRYFGHKRTIRPNAKQLYPLFMKRGNMSWDAFASQVRTIQKGYMGEPMEITPGRGEFHANPAACICEKTSRNSAIVKSISGNNLEPVTDSGIRKTIGISRPPYPVYTDEEADGSDTEEDPDSSGRGEVIDTEPDDDSAVRQEDPELEEILSD
ncbi:Uncharacterized protein Zm00014a_018665 [Zea mays]|uniref:O-fucosyltransferase family protein n=1 Tax=Zea mays TaxID=4577 RepID=A0A3L6DZ96_MAIZE|nr:Uncharacterized protein Zm00014a_018665 [Zea mays]